MTRRPTTRAFTLIELLVVMAIMGILAGLALPSIRDIGKSNATNAALRQLQDDMALARQRALNDRTEVYVVFSIKTNINLPVPPTLPAAQLQLLMGTLSNSIVANILTRQFTGYALYAARSVGDQPGHPTPRYLTAWRELPEATMIAAWKFSQLPVLARQGMLDDVVRPFAYRRFPVPTAQSPLTMDLPYVAFNAQGQVISEDLNGNGNYHDVVLPLARGSIFYEPDLTPDVRESPVGNSSNTYNHVRIDWLTGRARVERPELQ